VYLLEDVQDRDGMFLECCPLVLLKRKRRKIFREKFQNFQTFIPVQTFVDCKILNFDLTSSDFTLRVSIQRGPIEHLAERFFMFLILWQTWKTNQNNNFLGKCILF